MLIAVEDTSETLLSVLQFQAIINYYYSKKSLIIDEKLVLKKN